MKQLLLLFLTVAASAFAQVGDPLPNWSGGILKSGTVPVNGTNEIQTLSLGGTPTGGTFTLSFQGKTTGAITWTSTTATMVSRIDTALEALPTISNAGGGGVTTTAGTLTSGTGTVTITFTGNQAKLDVPLVTASSSLTGTSPTVSIATTTAGVTADGRTSAPGTLCIDVGDRKLYINQGTPPNPSWAVAPGS